MPCANRSLKAVLKAAEVEKYNDRIIQVEKGSFMPLVFSTNGAMGEQCDRLHKQLAKLTSEKTGEEYSAVMLHIRTKLRIALLKSVLIAVRGYRGPAARRVEETIPLTEIDFGQLRIIEQEGCYGIAIHHLVFSMLHLMFCENLLC